VLEALETELDRLFQLPPAALVEARNELADRLRKAGDKASAARVKSLKRPTPAAWALNQVHFAQPALLEQARAATETLRGLQARDGVDRLQLSAAVEAQRIAVRAVVEAAMQRCHAAGLTGGAPLSRKLLLTLQAWLAGASSELPGRMTQDVEPSGFDAIAEVGASPSAEQLAIPSLDSAPRAPIASKPRGPDRRALSQANAELEACEERAQTAREHTTRRRIEQDRARAELERASLRVRELEQSLAGLQQHQRQRAAEFERAERAAADAERQQREADQSVIVARERLAELKRAR
jgi:hypothetical protein